MGSVSAAPITGRRYRVRIAPVVGRPDMVFDVVGQLDRVMVSYFFTRDDGREMRVHARTIIEIEEVP